ncbi:PilX N-terminal domain-containing pilus assembly protein [Acinetobacter calcoaceticus]
MKVQKGSTLIVVLILLLVITVIGTLAVRQSLTSLNIATNSQAQQLLMQSSDSVLYRLGAEGFASASGNPTSLLGYALQNQGKEVVFCFRSQTSPATSFSVANTSTLQWNEENTDITVNGVSGFCDLSAVNDYASRRKAQMTQVAIVVNPPLSTPTRPLQIVTLGSDLESLGKLDNEQTKRIRVYVTSILPNLSDASQTAITNCLKRPNSQPLSGSNSTVSSCLQDLNVPFNTQFQDFVLSTYQRQNSV